MDIRKLTTQRRIQAGLIELLNEKSFAMCTVSDILSVAQVSKKTFYIYYSDEFALVKEIEDNLIHGLRKSLKEDRQELSQLKKYPLAKLDELADDSFDHTIAFCDQNKTWFSNLLSSNGDIRFLNRIYKLGSEEVTKRLPYYFGASYDEIKANDSNVFSAVKILYSHLIIDLACFWMANSQIMSIVEVKSLINIIQTQPFVKLMAYCRQTLPCS